LYTLAVAFAEAPALAGHLLDGGDHAELLDLRRDVPRVGEAAVLRLRGGMQ